jgi:hypothetical protein
MEPLTQSDVFAAGLRALGRPARLVDLDGAGRMLVVERRVPLLGPVGACLRGPVWACADSALRTDVLARRGPALIEAEEPPGAGYIQVMTGATVAEIDLAGAPSDWRARMAGKWRNRLVRAEGAGLVLRDMPVAGAALDHLLAAEAAQRAARRYRALPLALVPAMAAAAPRALRLFRAEARGDVLAAMLFVRHGAVATYHIGWAAPAGRKVEAHNLILWQAMGWLAARGVRRLDLGTVDTVGAPGIARFKIGAGADLRVLAGSWLRLPGAARWAGWKAGRSGAKGEWPA